MFACAQDTISFYLEIIRISIFLWKFCLKSCSKNLRIVNKDMPQKQRQASQEVQVKISILMKTTSILAFLLQNCPSSFFPRRCFVVSLSVDNPDLFSWERLPLKNNNESLPGRVCWLKTWRITGVLCLVCKWKTHIFKSSFTQTSGKFVYQVLFAFKKFLSSFFRIILVSTSKIERYTVINPNYLKL